MCSDADAGSVPAGPLPLKSQMERSPRHATASQRLSSLKAIFSILDGYPLIERSLPLHNFQRCTSESWAPAHAHLPSGDTLRASNDPFQSKRFLRPLRGPETSCHPTPPYADIPTRDPSIAQAMSVTVEG